MSPEKPKNAKKGDKVARIRIGSPVVEDYDLIKKDVVVDPEDKTEQRDYSVVDQSIGKTTLTYEVEIDQNTGEAVVAIDSVMPKAITGELLRASTTEVINNSGIHLCNVEFDQSHTSFPIERIVDAGLTQPEAA